MKVLRTVSPLLLAAGLALSWGVACAPSEKRESIDRGKRSKGGDKDTTGEDCKTNCETDITKASLSEMLKKLKTVSKEGQADVVVATDVQAATYKLSKVYSLLYMNLDGKKYHGLHGLTFSTPGNKNNVSSTYHFDKELPDKEKVPEVVALPLSVKIEDSKLKFESYSDLQINISKNKADDDLVAHSASSEVLSKLIEVSPDNGIYAKDDLSLGGDAIGAELTLRQKGDETLNLTLRIFEEGNGGDMDETLIVVMEFEKQ